MNKTIQFVFNLVKALRKLRDENLVLIESNPVAKQEFDELDNDYINMKQYLEIADIPIDNFTKEKAKARAAYISKLRSILSPLWAVGVNHDNLALISFADYSQSDLKLLRDSELVAKSNEIHTYCASHPDTQQEAGIIQEDLDALSILSKDFERTYELPRNERAKRKENNAKLMRYTRKVSKRIHHKLVPVMKGAYQDTEISLWNQFHTLVFNQSMKVNHYEVIGIIVDILTNEPLTGVTIRIQELNLVRTLKGKSGKFYLNDVPEGKYTVICTRPGYEPIEMPFWKIVGQTARVTIKMQTTNAENEEQATTATSKTKTRTQTATSTAQMATTATTATDQSAEQKPAANQPNAEQEATTQTTQNQEPADA